MDGVSWLTNEGPELMKIQPVSWLTNEGCRDGLGAEAMGYCSAQIIVASFILHIKSPTLSQVQGKVLSPDCATWSQRSNATHHSFLPDLLKWTFPCDSKIQALAVSSLAFMAFMEENWCVNRSNCPLCGERIT